MVLLIKNWKIETQITSKWFLLHHRMCVSDEVTLLFNSISRNFGKIMLCFRDMANLGRSLKGHN